MAESNAMPGIGPWSLRRRILFRLILLYFVLYVMPFPLDRLPFFGGWLHSAFDGIARTPIMWMGHLIFGPSWASGPTLGGSGDKSYDYISALFFLILSIAGTVGWSLLDRKTQNYSRLSFWLNWLVALFVGTQMIFYGAYKVINAQFGDLNILRLTERVGDQSPMRLLWNFMAYSQPYTAFAGFAELLGGVLLFFRRTRLVGSLLLIAVLSNVLMLNLSYDVPVKLYSFHLLMMSAFLVAPYSKYLWKTLVLHASAQGVSMTNDPLLHRSVGKWIFNGGKFLFMASVLAYGFHQSYTYYFKLHTEAPRRYTHYDVKLFALRGDTIPVNPARWMSFDIPDSSLATIKYADGATMLMPVKRDDAGHYVELGGGYKYRFNISPIDEQHELWEGTMGSTDSIKLVVEKSEGQFLLTSRDFHWINEKPFNQ